MNPELWRRVRSIFDDAIALPAPERSSYLDTACQGDPELHAEVESLLRSHQAAGGVFLNQPPPGLQVSPLAVENTPRRIGRRVGVYQIVNEIARGGMGEVYSASRVDGQYEKQVAIKLVRVGLDSPSLLERFRHERQILASLDHANIARLYDGGTTDDGVPFLVMELIQGTPVDQYCDAHNLDIRGRLTLFLQVCSAVQYAHQRLVIHRDIKPGNILVTADGVPKLLDFGIAKILDRSSGDTATMVRPMTPEYASPEQVRGESITTASDIYSLGVVLYRLLAGRSPYSQTPTAPVELTKEVCEIEPMRPSSAVLRSEMASLKSHTLPNESRGKMRERSQLLKGDIDAIVLTALRKEPDRRYASVESMAEDIRRYLEGRPISAVPDSRLYRLKKYVGRHKVAVTAAAMVAVVFLGGVLAILRQTRTAAMNERRAEQRFNDVRNLAGSLMFEIHDSIQNLPGSTAARKLIVVRSLEYLDSLAEESRNDPSLQRELATAYERVGEVQGSSFVANLGDSQGALASFQKALAIRQVLAKEHSNNVSDELALAGAYRRVGQMQWFSFGSTSDGLENLTKAVAIAEAAHPIDDDGLSELARDYKFLGDIQEGNGVRGSAGDFTDAFENHGKALRLLEQINATSRNNLSIQYELALSYAALGDDLVKAGQRKEALQQYKSCREILQPYASGGNTLLARGLATCYTRTGDALLMEGRANEALAYYSKELRLFDLIGADDPSDIDAQSYRITAQGDVGHALVQAGSIAEGRRLLLLSLQQQKALVKAHSDTHGITLLASTQILLGEAYEHSRQFSAAGQQYRDALATYTAIANRDTGDLEDAVNVIETRSHLARVYLALGQLPESRQEYEQACSAADTLVRRYPNNVEVLYALADASAGLGRLHASVAETSQVQRQVTAELRLAGLYRQKSERSWSQIPNPAHMSPNFFEISSSR